MATSEFVSWHGGSSGCSARSDIVTDNEGATSRQRGKRPTTCRTATSQLCMLRDDVLVLMMSFSGVSTLAAICALDRKLRKMAASHDHWRWYVLQYFGVYYEDYMRSVDVHDAYRWRRLFIYIRQVHSNVDRKKGAQRTMPQLLRPCTSADEEGAASSSSTSPRSISRDARRRRRRYRGSLELADNCNVFFWENGRIVQVVRAKDGKILREIDTGQTFRRYFHRLANVKNRLFVCLNDCIKVWEYGVHDSHTPPVELPPPRRLPSLAKIGRPLELLVHRRRLILLESNCCLLWDTDTFEFVCCIQHDDDNSDVAGVDPVGGSVPSQPTPHAAVAVAAPVTPAAATDGDRHTDSEELRALEVQWMGDLIVTWVRSASNSLKVWTLDGQLRAHLRMESPLVQVDVARVTWVSVKTLDHFILSALDSRSVVSLWDSKKDFQPIFRFYCGCDEPFDLVLTQDFMAVVNDNVADNCLELSFWRLWLHPNFEVSSDASSEADSLEVAARAARQRQATVEPGSFPAGARFSPDGHAHGRVADGGHRNGGQLDGEESPQCLCQELRPNARPIKKISISDLDSYFASYRNFLNVCSFHKSGQESLSVYRSSSLQKKIFFPPAKHTKFEEWLALQVHNDGSVVLHDFRPNQVAFDELAPDNVREPCNDRKDATPESTDGCRRRNEPPSHRFGSRSRGR